MLDSGGGFNPFTAMIVQRALTSGDVHRHIAHVSATLQRRCDALLDALRPYEALASVCVQPRGGYFVWLRLAPGLSVSELARLAAERQVAFAAGRRFFFAQETILGRAAPGETQHPFLRLCFAYHDEEELRRGARVLGEALQKLAGASRAPA